MTAPDRVYMTILAWPQDLDEAGRSLVLAACLGADAYRAREWARRAVPAVFKRDEALHAAGCIKVLGEKGVRAVAVPALSIKADREAPIAKGVTRVSASKYELDLGREGRASFDPATLMVALRAHVRDMGGRNEGDFGVQALHQLHGTFSAEDWSQGHTGRRRLHVVEVLDLHAPGDKQHWRIFGGKCAIENVAGVHGGSDATTARESVDGLLKQLQADAPRLHVDARFEQARFMGEIAPDFGVTGDWRSMAGFEVYSAWVRQVELALR